MYGASVGNGVDPNPGESTGAGRQPPPWKFGTGPAAMTERRY